MGIDAARDPELVELAKDVAPEAVLTKIEESEQRFRAETK